MATASRFVNFYQHLGIPRDEDRSSARRTIIQTIKLNHPDKHVTSSENVRQLVAAKTSILNDAKQIFSSDESLGAWRYVNSMQLERWFKETTSTTIEATGFFDPACYNQWSNKDPYYFVIKNPGSKRPGKSGRADAREQLLREMRAEEVRAEQERIERDRIYREKLEKNRRDRERRKRAQETRKQESQARHEKKMADRKAQQQQQSDNSKTVPPQKQAEDEQDRADHAADYVHASKKSKTFNSPGAPPFIIIDDDDYDDATGGKYNAYTCKDKDNDCGGPASRTRSKTETHRTTSSSQRQNHTPEQFIHPDETFPKRKRNNQRCSATAASFANDRVKILFPIQERVRMPY